MVRAREADALTTPDERSAPVSTVVRQTFMR